jgi:hypothetical protein
MISWKRSFPVLVFPVALVTVQCVARRGYEPPQSVRVYVLDCGSAKADNAAFAVPVFFDREPQGNANVGCGGANGC